MKASLSSQAWWQASLSLRALTSVTGLRSFDKEGAGLWVAAGRHRLTGAVVAAGVNTTGDDRVSIGDMEHRWMRANGGVVDGWRELVDCHAPTSS